MNIDNKSNSAQLKQLRHSLAIKNSNGTSPGGQGGVGGVKNV